MQDFAWLIVWLPLLGFLFNAFLGKKMGKRAREIAVERFDGVVGEEEGGDLPVVVAVGGGTHFTGNVHAATALPNRRCAICGIRGVRNGSKRKSLSFGRMFSGRQ